MRRRQAWVAHTVGVPSSSTSTLSRVSSTALQYLSAAHHRQSGQPIRPRSVGNGLNCNSEFPTHPKPPLSFPLTPSRGLARSRARVSALMRSHTGTCVDKQPRRGIPSLASSIGRRSVCVPWPQGRALASGAFPAVGRSTFRGVSEPTLQTGRIPS